MKIGQAWKQFVKHESSSGVILFVAAAFAMLAINSPAKNIYQSFISYPIGYVSSGVHFQEPLYHWVNDALMVLFFLLVGLEIKREMKVGELSKPAQRVLPAFAALGGMFIPALIYYFINRGDSEVLHGWAISSATDIAFSLAVLSLLGNRVSPALKVFLMALAIYDDLGAIVIIALFYTQQISFYFLGFAAIVLLFLLILNRMKVSALSPYLLLGVFLWFFVYRSGVHATVAGVLLALTIPLKGEKGDLPLQRLIEKLHGVVAFLIVPLFGFVNSGIDLSEISLYRIFEPLPLGIAGGLFFGKQIGIFFTSMVLIKSGLAKLPQQSGWRELYGVSIIAGIGFTMSLFIGGLSFFQEEQLVLMRLGVIFGSLLSAGIGYLYFISICKQTTNS